jgi:hypothetical protein
MYESDFSGHPACNSSGNPTTTAKAAAEAAGSVVSEHITNLVSQILQDKQLHRAKHAYIQAVEIEQGACVASNCLCATQVEIAPIASGWAIGRSPTCAIRIQHNSISRCHAILSYQPELGFYLTDLGSSNGTWLNSQRLNPMQRYGLQDGDRLRIGKFIVDFYMARSVENLPMRVCDETYSGEFAPC